MRKLLTRFPWMANRLCNAQRSEAGEEKPMLYLHEHLPGKLIGGFPLRAVLLPRFIPGNATCKVVPVAPQSAFKAIVQSTVTQLTGAGSEAMSNISALVHQLPCYLVGLGSDLREIPDVICELLTEPS